MAVKLDNTPPNQPDVGRTLSLLWMMYLTSSGVFVAVGYLIIRSRMTAIEIPPAVLVGISVAGFAVGELAVRLGTKSVGIADARKRLLFSLIALSLVELVAIGGIVVAWLLRSVQPLIILGGVALFVFYRLAAILR